MASKGAVCSLNPCPSSKAKRVTVPVFLSIRVRLTTEPLNRLQYVDTTARVGVRYVYVVIAVDAAGNPSAQSNRKIVDRFAPAGR